MTRSGEEAMHEKDLAIGLFDPGMTELHRVGLAGLYMTLKSLNLERYADVGGWELTPQLVHMHWKKKASEFFTPLFKESIQIAKEGYIAFNAHQSHAMGDLERVELHRAICDTYLQHGKTRKMAKTEKTILFDFQDKTVARRIKPMSWFRNQDGAKLILNSSGERLRSAIPLAGWSFPGGAVRHNEFNNVTALSMPSRLFLPLIFAPVATLYFMISHRNRDGSWDKRRKAALVIPHINDLEKYSRDYCRYLSTPLKMLHADGLGDAALMGLSLINLKTEMLAALEIPSCSVMTFGSVPWSRQQKTRTGLRQVSNVNTSQLNLFSLALHYLENRVCFRENDDFYVSTSPSHGLIAENIAAKKDWFNGFHELMASQKQARSVAWERKGLNEMISKMEWDHEADRLLVEAVHQALRNRYGALAKRAQEKGEAVQFGREFERIRSSLMRAKNAQTLRGELADLFARGGLNKTLQRCWPELLPLFTGADWQRAKDLSLLALASYVGHGAETVDESINDNKLKEDEIK